MCVQWLIWQSVFREFVIEISQKLEQTPSIAQLKVDFGGKIFDTKIDFFTSDEYQQPPLSLNVL